MSLAALDRGLLSLQAALFGREVMGEGHASVRHHEEEATRALQEAARTSGECVVIAFDHRILWNDTALPSGKQLLEGLFARLGARGWRCITVRADVSASAVAGVLASLSRAADAPSPPTDGLILGSLAEQGTAQIASGASGKSEPMSERLRRVWGEHTAGGLNFSAMTALVGDICTSVSTAGNALPQLVMLKNHDEYTFVHTINVSMLSAALGEAVGLPSNRVFDLTIAAILHDIGKRAIPEEVINKAGRYTPEELKIMQRHPIEGARILLDEDHIPDTAVAVAYEHHMHLDGTGYPAPTKGWRPHLVSRIVQLADVYDAMRTHRPYRAAMTHEQAEENIRAKSSTCYDAALVDVFLSRVAIKPTAPSATIGSVAPPQRAAA